MMKKTSENTNMTVNRDRDNDANVLLDQIAKFRLNIDKLEGNESKKLSFDEMVVNLGNPRLAEKIRIHKVN